MSTPKESLKQLSADQVTLAIPAFNCAAYLKETLHAVARLNQKPAHVLVIDDGSTDSTGSVASSAGVTVVKHEINKGLGAARQTALDNCRTPWLAMVDSDVSVEPDWLAQLLLAAKEHQLSGVGGDLLESNARTVADRWRARMMAQTHGGELKLDVNLFGCNTLHSAAALRTVGGFNPRYTKAYEDIDISERLKKAGFKLGYTPLAKCVHARRDTLTSVLKAAFSWRLPRYEEQGCYDNSKALMNKWVQTFREDLRELNMLTEEGNGELSFPCLVQLFTNPIMDLEVVAVRSESMKLRGLTGIGTAMVLLVLKRALISEELKQRVGLALKPFIESVTKTLERVALPHEDNPELQRLVTATIDPWTTVLALSPENTAKLLASANQTLNEG